MKANLTLIFVLLCSVASDAREWRPFVGVGGGVDMNAPFTQLDLNGGSMLGIIPTYSLTVRGGGVSGNMLYYAGYHIQDFGWIRDYDNWYRYNYGQGDSGRYSERRDKSVKMSWLELGCRWLPGLSRGGRIVPAMGAALVFSEAKLTEYRTSLYRPVGQPTEEYGRDRAVRKSAVNVGIMPEFGFRAYPAKHLALDLISRLHIAGANFEQSGVFPAVEYLILIPMFELGVNWELGGWGSKKTLKN